MHQYDELLGERSGQAALIGRATDGDESAFAELYEQHAHRAWGLAYALTGTTRDAVAVVSDSFARTFTALRAGRAVHVSFPTLLLGNVRHQAIDARNAHGADAPPFEASEETVVLATAFASLPERWRSALWLREVERLDTADLAPVIELDVDATTEIVARARKGLREQFVRADMRTTKDRNCGRAGARLSAYAAGTLPGPDVEKLERHLRLCETCTERHSRLTAIGRHLPTLVPALPAMLEDDVRIAWTGAVSTTGFGLSRFGEKLVAGVAALAAGVGVLGAAMVSVGSGNDDQAVAPLAPIVTELASPRPPAMDLRIELDPDADTGAGATSEAASLTPDDEFDGVIGAAARRDSAPVVTDLDGGDDTPSGTPTGGGEEPPTTVPPGPGPGDSGTDPAISVGADVGGLPVAVEVGDDTGVTVGPISVGSEPTPGDAPISVGGPLAPLAPIVNPISEGVGGLLGG